MTSNQNSAPSLSKAYDHSDNKNPLDNELTEAEKPILSMTSEEIRQKFKLKKINCYVRLKNLRKIYRTLKKHEEMRNKKWEEEMRKNEERQADLMSNTNGESRNNSRSPSQASSYSDKKSRSNSKSPSLSNVNCNPSQVPDAVHEHSDRSKDHEVVNKPVLSNSCVSSPKEKSKTSGEKSR